jgi:hypothetical protein
MKHSPDIQTLGANPANIKWTVVRGDTAKIRISFFESDEVENYNTDGWTYIPTAYSAKTNTFDTLTVVEGIGYVDIIAPSSITETWGTGYSNIVAELPFDLQVTMPAEDPSGDPTIWTPVIGIISVIGDTTRGL